MGLLVAYEIPYFGFIARLYFETCYSNLTIITDLHSC